MRCLLCQFSWPAVSFTNVVQYWMTRVSSLFRIIFALKKSPGRGSGWEDASTAFSLGEPWPQAFLKYNFWYRLSFDFDLLHLISTKICKYCFKRCHEATHVFHFRAQIQNPVPYGKKKNECCFLSLRSSQQFLLPGKALRTNKKITIEQQKPTTKASKKKAMAIYFWTLSSDFITEGDPMGGFSCRIRAYSIRIWLLKA